MHNYTTLCNIQMLARTRALLLNFFIHYFFRVNSNLRHYFCLTQIHEIMLFVVHMYLDSVYGFDERKHKFVFKKKFRLYITQPFFHNSFHSVIEKNVAVNMYFDKKCIVMRLFVDEKIVNISHFIPPPPKMNNFPVSRVINRLRTEKKKLFCFLVFKLTTKKNLGQCQWHECRRVELEIISYLQSLCTFLLPNTH